MNDWLRWLAGLKGIEVEDGAELHLELGRFPESGGLALLAVLGSLLALWLVVWLYRRDRAELAPWPRATLAALRALAVLLALVLLFEPNLVATKRTVRQGHALLLVDDSQSMAKVDSFRRPEVQPLADGWRAVGADPTRATRLELAKAALLADGAAALRALQRDNQLLGYGFSAGAEPMPVLAPAAPTDGTEPPPPLPDVAGLIADGRYTNLGQAVRTALERSRDAAIAAVVLVSDGRRNLGPQGGEVARLLAQRKVPQVVVLAVGDPTETQRVALRRVDAPGRVFQKDPFRVTAEVEAQGYPDLDLAVRLLRLEEGAEHGQVLQVQTVRLPAATPNATVVFDDVTAETAGLATYRVELIPPDGEPPAPEAHRQQVRVQVLGERTRVLMIAGGPTPEYHVLRDTLTRDKTIDLSCWLQSADADFAQEGNTPLEQLPQTREELAPFDVFLLVDPDAGRLTAEACTHAAEQIDREGAGLWWVAGERHTVAALRAGAPTEPLARLLPIEPDQQSAERTLSLGYAYETAWAWQLTPEGARHPLAHLVDDTDDPPQAVWPRLPGFYWAYPVAGLKPAAVAIAVHSNPQLRHLDGRPMAILAAQAVGTGRVLWSGTDETYRWRGRAQPAYEKLWVKGIRWLFEGRLHAGGRRTNVAVSAEKIELGEPVTVTVDARTPQFEPLSAPHFDVQLVAEETVAQSLRLMPAADGTAGRFETTFRPERPGFYRLLAEGAEASVQVVRAAVEREGPVDLATLSALTAGSEGGTLVQDPRQLAAALAAIPSMSTTDVFRSSQAMWDTWFTVALLLGVLALEWWLRKRWNLI